MPDNQADSELNRELREAPEAIQAPGELAGRREVRSYGSLQLGILGMGMGYGKHPPAHNHGGTSATATARFRRMGLGLGQATKAIDSSSGSRMGANTGTDRPVSYKHPRHMPTLGWKTVCVG